MTQGPAVTPYIETAFAIAQQNHPDEYRKWIDLSYRLAGRAALVPLIVNLQRLGQLDLILRSMEDELATSRAPSADPSGFGLHYQMMLSESWVVACYEAMRAIRQRENEATEQARVSDPNYVRDGVSDLTNFGRIFTDLELLRMPMAKYEIAKDDKLKAPLKMQSYPRDNDTTNESVYDRSDASRSHIMPSGVGNNGSVMWQVLDHRVPAEYWVERRELSNRLLALAVEIEPAGLREARLAAEKTEPSKTSITKSETARDRT